ncbi:hypothetical protein RHMOL_Rhmol07G0150000 [Rhododendron molle]|uniref:Uncharacterized protein n=1 Tax=Rhododendron molle TaxID=49168 RepID=A0ACC0N1X1_RHOML|nr:hypothetical protein RHMOL_Rhmol07G0150000 [Rhododendron molle]
MRPPRRGRTAPKHIQRKKKRLNFNPYNTRKRVVPDIAFYTGPIHYMDVVEQYLPDRMLRQFGLQQDLVGVFRCSPEYLPLFRSVSHPRVGCGEALVRGRACEEEVLVVLEVVDKAMGDTGLGAVELRAALQEV